MARLINLDNAIAELKDLSDNPFVMTDEQIKFFLAQQSIIEAEPVVYCKNCIRWQKDKTYNIGWCGIVNEQTSPKNFCCWGENSPFRNKDGD